MKVSAEQLDFLEERKELHDEGRLPQVRGGFADIEGGFPLLHWVVSGFSVLMDELQAIFVFEHFEAQVDLFDQTSVFESRNFFLNDSQFIDPCEEFGRPYHEADESRKMVLAGRQDVGRSCIG